MDDINPIARRTVLRGLGALIGSAVGAGFPAPAFAQVQKCANACRSVIGKDDRWIAGLPIIDAHCHIFNARDIPAARFLTNVFLPNYAFDLSPAKKAVLEREITGLMSGMLSSTPGYAQERALLETRLAGEAVPKVEKVQTVLPDFSRGGARTCFGQDVAHNVSAFGNLIGILKNFRYRNFEALATTYETGLESVSVALYTPAMVDMEYWLVPEREPPEAVGDVGDDAFSLPQATIGQQIELTEMIQRLYAGRVHAFAPFCPWRQVDDLHHNARVGEISPRRRDTALELVEDAVLNRGFAGVKLYPPMGFLPIGNAELPLSAFPPWARDLPYADTFGSALDEALRSLYRFCVEHDVPVMAHCAETNGAGSFSASDDREENYALRAHPFGWARVMAEPEFSGLRLNLAHFGSSRDAGHEREWRAVIGQMMDQYDHVYADLSHYAEMVLDSYSGTGQRCREAAAILDALRKGFLVRPAGDRRVGRLLYGSDWSMLSKEFYYADYLRVAAHMYRRKIYGVGRGAEKNAQAFLCGNAVRFLGLRKGEKARARLDAWYARHGLDGAVLERFDKVEA